MKLLFTMAASVMAFVLTIACFAPRFIYWSWIDLDSSEHHAAEFNRAIDTLRQLERPFVPITNPTNSVINWRLLFPFLGHVLHLPRWAFLALPSLGCLLVLGYVAHLVRREGGTRWSAILATALSATTSWFFVSTGWLAYFDSWYVLGLLVATFSRSPYAAAAACLLSPWVDERFVLALPLVVLVRGISAGMLEGGISKRFRSEGMLFFALMVPYCSLRLIALASRAGRGVGRTPAQSFRNGAPCRRGDLRTLVRFEGALGVCDGRPRSARGRGRMVQAGLLVRARRRHARGGRVDRH